MRTTTRWLLLPVAAATLALGAPDDAPTRARAAANELTTTLKARLVRELESGGPVAAARVCSEVAQTIAAAHSKEGVTVRRVSVRWRNPADRPDAWEAERLAEMEAAVARGEAPAEVEEVQTEGGVSLLRYLQPIRIAPPCLTCHGDPETFPAELRQLLSERYAADTAVGYRVGDLRGAVSVTVRPAQRGEATP
ncbi:MAG: DUF3365 domain-containing protein [Acidobacteria bacterium]|nr:DUF3365 domain-containing protein [Acidobacteriota bacterium]